MVDKQLAEEVRASGATVEREILHDLGYFGHFLHVHAGGRSGKQHVLSKLLEHGNRLTQRQLLEMSCISSAAMSEVLMKLQSEGLITRTRSEEDRRQLDIVLTEEGLHRAREAAQRRLAFQRESVSVLSMDEKYELVDMLDRLMAHWQLIEESIALPQECETGKEMECGN